MYCSKQAAMCFRNALQGGVVKGDVKLQDVGRVYTNSTESMIRLLCRECTKVDDAVAQAFLLQ